MGKGDGAGELLFRVRFRSRDGDDKNPIEVVVRRVESSEFIGLLTLTDFVFNDQTRQVILPTEDEARKRYSRVHRLHVPYHNIISIEEFDPEPVDVRQLPFVKPVAGEASQDQDPSPPSHA